MTGKELEDKIKEQNKTIDEFVKLNHRQLSKINELRQEINDLKKEHKDDKFKLQTLEKFYTCPNCAFNNREFQYLRSLKLKE